MIIATIAAAAVAFAPADDRPALRVNVSGMDRTTAAAALKAAAVKVCRSDASVFASRASCVAGTTQEALAGLRQARRGPRRAPRLGALSLPGPADRDTPVPVGGAPPQRAPAA